MNKKLRELLDAINAKKTEIANLVNDGKLDEAKTAKDELKNLQEQFDILKDIVDPEGNGQVQTPKNAAPKDSVHEFADAARARFQNINNEGTGADGGYTVPQDIQTRINKYKEAKFSLRTLVDSEAVTTMSGRRTYQKRSQHSGFSSVSEAGAIGAVSGPEFEVVNYSVTKYAGYIPVTNELLEDSDANITNVLVEWLGEEELATDNAIVLGAIAQKTPEVVDGLDGIKGAINVTLGQAFAGSSRIVTNDDGFNWLDTLKITGSNEYLLKPEKDQTNPMFYTLAVGARRVPVVVVPNSVLKSEPVYEASTDTSVNSAKTYYTRSGSAGSYVYTKVASPTGNPSTSSYYEHTADNLPMIIGDLKAYAKIFERKGLTLLSSNVAAAGSGGTAVNAFEQDLTLIRAIKRLDIEVLDDEAIVNGYIAVSLGE